MAHGPIWASEGHVALKPHPGSRGSSHFTALHLSDRQQVLSPGPGVVAPPCSVILSLAYLSHHL